ncbi:MAG: galactose mutarotase [Lachnospiraceae bacterium]|nr:galactose mutarotase [Lachnospiraceae bacterium]
MKITKTSFGTTKNGEKATLYTMENSNGMKVSVTDYGATIVHIIVPDRDGKMADVSLGYDDVKGYDENGTYYGAFIGRNGNRIANASFTLNGVKYDLDKNDGPNNLHGGFKGYNNFFFETECFEEEGEVSVEMSRLSPDMEQGFPGNLDITVTYTLTEENELAIEYLGVSDKDTIVNLTNHTFFNLAGHDSGTILDHKVFIDADYFTPTDDGLIPTGELRTVDGTPMDFRTEQVVGDRIDADYEPLKQAGGYDHNYVLNNSGEDVEYVASLYDPKSGRRMEVFTDLPGMQLYAGNFIDGKATGKGGKVYTKREGICFETQLFPDACNEKEFFKSSVVKAYEEYSTMTVYKFSVDK